MEKQNLSYDVIISCSIIAICIISLIIGLFTRSKTVVAQSAPLPQVVTPMFSTMDTPGDKIALLNIDGVISSDSGATAWATEFSTDAFLNSLEKAQKDSKVKAVLIRINSPGGTVAASQDIYDAILRLRQTKPVVVSMADVAASGGYYVASAADRIVAQKGTMTGSIGVIFNFVDVSKLADKWGINSNVIKSGKFKDAGSMYRKMTSAEEDLFQESVNTAYSQFVKAITEGRINRKDDYKVAKTNLSAENLEKHADGRVFLGEDAYELGFVDAIGSQYDAIKIANEMAGKTNLPVVSYNKANGIKSLLMGIENISHSPLQNIIPFSYKHNNSPLLLME